MYTSLQKTRLTTVLVVFVALFSVASSGCRAWPRHDDGCHGGVCPLPQSAHSWSTDNFTPNIPENYEEPEYDRHYENPTDDDF
ncbi:MAG TPA: hypothetical protein PKD64_03040 [Pirellulaceae bacterium]|nr:hypothetical protein [Pirellulaceae bacterium]HMO91145.1 hypothetical protein [Pirellulaceae bacterium]HMP69084.1 hypothetical protein [Pirellulaceae bacterium]